MKVLEYVYYCDECNGKCPTDSHIDSKNPETGECLCIDCGNFKYMQEYGKDYINNPT